MEDRLSTKDIPARDRLIVALDVPTHDEAYQLIERLGDACTFYKVGLELFLAGNYRALLRSLVEDRCKKAFIDLKLFDVPETVHNAVRQLEGCGATFATVHGNDAMLAASCQARKELKILAVTVLTSLDRADIQDLGFRCSVEELVVSRARRAVAIGCDGVIASGREAPALRSQLGEGFLIVSPGIRPVSNDVDEDDQKRVSAPEDAFRGGADYIVVGRPIREAPDPRAVGDTIQETIARLFGT